MSNNGYTYSNENGKNISANANNVQAKPSEPRNPALQLKAGGEKRLPTDDGGHLIAHSLGGANNETNLVAMDRGLNRGEYKKMELAVKKAVQNNPENKVSLKVNTSGSAKRPDTFQVTSQMKDSKGKVVDVSHNSYTNLEKSKQEKVNAESGTDFMGYKDMLTKEQRKLANEVSEQFSTMNIKDGLDTGWKYVHKGEKKMSDHERHQKFAEQYKVEIDPKKIKIPPTKDNKNNKTDDGSRIRTKGNDRGGDLKTGSKNLSKVSLSGKATTGKGKMTAKSGSLAKTSVAVGGRTAISGSKGGKGGLATGGKGGKGGHGGLGSGGKGGHGGIGGGGKGGHGGIGGGGKGGHGGIGGGGKGGR